MAMSKSNGLVGIIANRTAIRYLECYRKLPESVEGTADQLHKFFEDEKNMKVLTEKQLDKDGICEFASRLIAEHGNGKYKMIVFYFIGHGEKGELLPYCNHCEKGDNTLRKKKEPLQILELIKMFHNDGNMHLRQIPILFFFDCCQGAKFPEGMESMGGPIAPSEQISNIVSYTDKIPNVGNILIAHSALPGIMAYTHRSGGPLWSAYLLENLRKDQSICDALSVTQHHVSKVECGSEKTQLQLSMFYSTLCCETINFYHIGGSPRTSPPHHPIIGMGKGSPGGTNPPPNPGTDIGKGGTQIISRIHLGEIAKEVVQWQGDIADGLELSAADAASIVVKQGNNLNLQVREALSMWMQRLGDRATYNALIQVFEKAGHKNLADFTRKLIIVEYY